MNPEFKKHLWLEMSLHRILATPILIAIVTGMMIFLMDIVGDLSLALDIFFLGGFWCFACLGGVYTVAHAAANENYNKTWDWVRLGSQSSWSITWGKIFGASSYMWYGAGWFAALYLLLPLFYEPPIANSLRIKKIILYFFMALFFQAISFLGVFATGNLTAAKKTARNYGSSAALLVLVLGSPFFNVGKFPAVTWFYNTYDSLEFFITSMVIFAILGWIGAYRTLRAELQYKNGIILWLIFNLYITLYISGFIVQITAFEKFSSLLIITSVGFFIGIISFYITLFSNPPSIRSINTLITYTTSKSWSLLEKSIPVWAVSLLLCGVILSMMVFIHDAKVITFCLGLWLLAIRDTGVLISFIYGKKSHRAVVTTLIYLAFFYAILPIFIVRAFKDQQDQVSNYLQIFLPGTESFGLIYLFVEAVLVLAWCHYRIKKQHDSLLKII